MMKKGKKVNIPDTKIIENIPTLILTHGNSIKKIKNITIIVSIISLIIYICNLYYLHNLKDCVCFKMLNIDKKINLNYLLAINYSLLFILIINIINTSTTQKGGSSFNIFIYAIILLLFISIYSYYIYNIYEIYKKDSISKYCDCLESKFKYSLYIHGALLSINVVILTIALILYLTILWREKLF